ncbi:MAG: 16S rRNA (cytidine(1402)-2'-O)-methyltransferase [Elusimicrobiota bacterium]|jgi:16S rRNA (cytidine1402-2'-O)-methyltransferase
MLYLVPTPIGNLEDITLRALKALAEAKVVYCEDTRRTRILMERNNLAKPLIRYDERDPRCMEGLLERLRRSETVALVSDAGTPVVSDPGARLVALARKEGLSVCSLPGPSALTTALCGSGLPADSCVFLGFLPRAHSKRLRALKEAATLGKTLAVYESPFRVLELLKTAEEALGPEAQAVIARELTKIHEEWLTGTIRSVREALEKRNGAPGEYVVLFHPRALNAEPAAEEEKDEAGPRLPPG